VKGYNEVSADGRFLVKEGECMGACADAPVMIVDNKRMCSFMSREKIDGLVEELKK
jgi:NADH-quinone oxidoreductase subunit E